MTDVPAERAGRERTVGTISLALLLVLAAFATYVFLSFKLVDAAFAFGRLLFTLGW